jgi:hypothetical protein
MLDAKDSSASCFHISYCAWASPQKMKEVGVPFHQDSQSTRWHDMQFDWRRYHMTQGFSTTSVSGTSQAFKPLFSLLRKKGEPYGSASANDRRRCRCRAEWMKRYLRQSDFWRCVALYCTCKTRFAAAKRDEKLTFRIYVT